VQVFALRYNGSYILSYDTTNTVGIFAFGRAVLYYLILFVFALAERKNEKNKIGKYHAAAGYKAR
jgi:hypothetical protein